MPPRPSRATLFLAGVFLLTFVAWTAVMTTQPGRRFFAAVNQASDCFGDELETGECVNKPGGEPCTPGGDQGECQYGPCMADGTCPTEYLCEGSGGSCDGGQSCCAGLVCDDEEGVCVPNGSAGSTGSDGSDASEDSSADVSSSGSQGSSSTGSLPSSAGSSNSSGSSRSGSSSRTSGSSTSSSSSRSSSSSLKDCLMAGSCGACGTYCGPSEIAEETGEDCSALCPRGGGQSQYIEGACYRCRPRPSSSSSSSSSSVCAACEEVCNRGSGESGGGQAPQRGFFSRFFGALFGGTPVAQMPPPPPPPRDPPVCIDDAPTCEDGSTIFCGGHIGTSGGGYAFCEDGAVTCDNGASPTCSESYEAFCCSGELPPSCSSVTVSTELPFTSPCGGGTVYQTYGACIAAAPCPTFSSSSSSSSSEDECEQCMRNQCGSSSSSSTFCGDAKVQGSEECDDGNTKNGDCCSKSCAVERGCSCENPEGEESSASSATSTSRSSSSSRPAAGCTDSDGGDDILTKGTARIWPPDREKTDYCVSITKIMEYRCAPPGSLRIDATVHSCVAGTYCEEGACIEVPDYEPPEDATCTDTDGGIVPEVKGTVRQGSSAPSTDSCYGSGAPNRLTEYYCEGSISQPKGVASTTIECPAGCTNGACNPP